MSNEERLKKVMAEHGASIRAQIKKGATAGFVFGYFAWSLDESGEVEIEFLN